MTTVLDIVGPPLVDGHDIADRFSALELLLPEGDGIWWFCVVHEVMSDTVASELATGGFEDPAMLERLDVHLVSLFFAAVAAEFEHGVKAVRKSWRPVFARRSDPDVQPLRFALAGINAHISTDLARAVVLTCQGAGTDPTRDSAFYRDYCRINELETALRVGVKERVYSQGLQSLDKGLGTVDDQFETFGFWAAREAAWVNGDVIATLPGLLADAHRDTLDRTTGFVNRLLLIG